MILPILIVPTALTAAAAVLTGYAGLFGALVVTLGYTPGLVFILATFIAGFLLLQLVPKT